MVFQVRAARQGTDEAGLHLRNADRLENGLQQLSLDARHELDVRRESLEELNRPTLFATGGHTSGS
jgi:hypothetical protein